MNIRRLLCWALVLISATAAVGQQETEYFAIFADGGKIGHSMRQRKVEAGKVITTELAVMTITRMGIPLMTRQKETCIETPKGEPLAFESVQDMAAIVQKINGKVGPDGKIHV